MGDFDGCGQCSECMLVQWIDYFLDVCLDQVCFMDDMFDGEVMELCFGVLLNYEQYVVWSGVCIEVLWFLYYLFSMCGELFCGEFVWMIGLGECIVVMLIGKLFEIGFLVFDMF